MRAQTTSAGHELLPHTADVILHAWGNTRAACLAEAAVGLVDGVTVATAPPPTDVDIALCEPDDAELLLLLLEEVLFLIDSTGVVPVAADLRDEDGRLEGHLQVVPIDALTGTTTVAKGVSRTDLSCARTDGGWECWAIVDV